MKHVLFVLVVSITVFVVGCQDSNMTGPVANSSHQLLKPTPNTGSTVLKGDVLLSSSGTTGEGMVFHVNGQMSYEYKITGEGEAQVYEFSINTQATLLPSNPILAQGSVGDQSIYQIAAASKQGVVFTQRDYDVPDLSTKFHVILAIAEDNSFSVQSMWLDPMNLNGSKALNHGLAHAGSLHEIIDLNADVAWEHQEAVNGIWTIVGQVAYTLTPVQQGISVDISIDGNLAPAYISGNSSPLSGQSSDLIQVPGSQPVILDKEYLFDGGEGPEMLHVRYSVSDVAVSVDHMWVVPFSGGLGLSIR